MGVIRDMNSKPKDMATPLELFEDRRNIAAEHLAHRRLRVAPCFDFSGDPIADGGVPNDSVNVNGGWIVPGDTLRMTVTRDYSFVARARSRLGVKERTELFGIFAPAPGATFAANQLKSFQIAEVALWTWTRRRWHRKGAELATDLAGGLILSVGPASRARMLALSARLSAGELHEGR